MLHLCSEHYEIVKDDPKMKDKKEKVENDAKKLEAETGRALDILYTRAHCILYIYIIQTSTLYTRFVSLI